MKKVLLSTLAGLGLIASAVSCTQRIVSPGLSVTTISAQDGQTLATGDLGGVTSLEVLIQPKKPQPSATGGGASLDGVQRTGALRSKDKGALSVSFEVCPVVRDAKNGKVSYQFTDS